MKVKEINVKVQVKFSWMKYVYGADLSNHCAKSLIGEYENGFNRDGNPEISDLELKDDAPFYYFCAVTQNYRTNVHVAWRKKEGSTMVVDNALIRIVVEDAEEIPINNFYVDRKLQQYSQWIFRTCRNWWFASYIHLLGY